MKKRYTVELFIPDRFSPSWRLQLVIPRRSVETAVRSAERLLQKYTYRRTRRQRIPRVAFCKIKRDGVTIDTIEPREIIVPSVGELGYW